MKTAFRTLALASALALCACAHRHTVHNTPNFQAGYADGCEAASGGGASYRAGPTRDEALYTKDADYRDGWNIGYSSCRRGGAMPGEPSSGPIPDTGPGH
ncbi:MAG: hypothetical protein KGR48_17540 [Alphaproteobacteria bacterium]|nr:hypothetical protein [Alphaproteobacteria bacterium]MBU6472746.1 hypothetical protein [Alphaproteobacteria bacterium]MDE2013610.1 hypothetical protein [Alphaproteobacteria bacterium]MDE2074251.1 hypothetical protein [Alphaproteobacteria bacterium]MDE2351799.1 hypothetical protein [Alphaproteobacteria bacterium]